MQIPSQSRLRTMFVETIDAYQEYSQSDCPWSEKKKFEVICVSRLILSLLWNNYTEILLKKFKYFSLDLIYACMCAYIDYYY